LRLTCDKSFFLSLNCYFIDINLYEKGKYLDDKLLISVTIKDSVKDKYTYKEENIITNAKRRKGYALFSAAFALPLS